MYVTSSVHTVMLYKSSNFTCALTFSTHPIAMTIDRLTPLAKHAPSILTCSETTTVTGMTSYLLHCACHMTIT